MAVVFLLGPSEWATRRHGEPPMQVRRNIGRVLTAGGHHVILMEDIEDFRGEDLIEKFDRILHTGVTDVVVYWPAEVQRYLTELVDDGFLHARPYAKKGEKVLVEYGLSRKGEAHLDALDAYRGALEKHGAVVGKSSIQSLEAVYA